MGKNRAFIPWTESRPGLLYRELGENPVERWSPVGFLTDDFLPFLAFPRAILPCPALPRGAGLRASPQRTAYFWWAATALPWLGRGSRPVTSLVNVERPLGENERRQRNRVLWPEVGVRPLPVNFLVQLRLLGKTCNESFHFAGS